MDLIVEPDIYSPSIDEAGNYIDKILFTYKQMPAAVSEIRPFVEKPRGQRY